MRKVGGKVKISRTFALTSNATGSNVGSLMSNHKRLRGPYKKRLRCPQPCGKRFRPRIKTQVHCSAKCRNRAAQMAYRKRQRALRKKAA